jgi:hypothetical protein
MKKTESGEQSSDNNQDTERETEENVHEGGKFCYTLLMRESGHLPTAT